ncbi:MAG: replicative DNA helicase [Puniceicoccales bacterium]|jgi:replicative DNA helicase|nr:replicative DNA helicase [Puniceicoccales bacterium]
MAADLDKKMGKSGGGDVARQLVGRVHPHSVDFEQALLACCIMEGGRDSIDLCVQQKITSASFYLPSHKLLWEAILSIYDDNGERPINEIFLADRLKSLGKLDSIGGIDFINRICDRIDTPAHITHYIKRVRDLELIRRVVAASMTNIERAYGGSDNLDDFIEKAENEIFAISSDRFSDCAIHVKKSIDSAVNTFQSIRTRKELTGLPSGFADLDKITFGFRRGEMVVVAARPSIGKTSLAMNIAENVILAGKGKDATGVLFFSLEMSSEQLALRMLCGRAGINMTKLYEGFVPKSAESALNDIAKELKAAPLWIDESTNLTILEMRAKARRMCSREKIGLIIIDYLQLINGDSRVPREQQISEISRGVKAMAKELKIPVIVLSQLNRDSEKEKRLPKLSDLRESGAIEQDADLVMILAKQTPAKDEGAEEQPGADVVIRDLIVAKHRNGPIGVVSLSFVRNLTRFENYTDEKIYE